MSENPPTVWPAFRYDDAHAALKFLTEVFGFREALVVPGEDGQIVHAELRWPEGGGFMFGSTSYTEGVHGEMKNAGSAYVVTDQVDAIHERTKAAGAEIVEPPHDTDYGSHTFTVRDPEGNLWTFGTYRGAA